MIATSLVLSLLGLVGGQAQDTPAASAATMSRYLAAVRTQAVGLGVDLRKLELRGDCLYVVYERRGQGETDAFLLAAVATLVKPLAVGAKTLELVGVRGKQQLFDVTAPPETIDSLYVADLTAREKERLAAMAAVLAQPAPPAPAAPKRSAAATQQEPAAMPAVSVKHPVEAGVGQAAVLVPVPRSSLTEGQERELAQAVRKALAEAQLENLRVGVDAAGGWFISFENRTYRDDLAAMGAVFKALGRLLPLGEVTLQATRDAVPICTLRVDLADYARAEAGLVTEENLRHRWQVRPGGQGVAEPVRMLAAGNDSYGRTDISLRPSATYRIGEEGDPFKSDLYLLSQADSTLQRGWHGRVRLSTRLTSGPGTVVDSALLTDTRWVNDHLLVTGSVGKLRENLYGAYGEAQRDWGSDRLGFVGLVFGCDLGDDDTLLGFAYYEHEFGQLGLTARLGYGSFLETRRHGASLALQRRFGESVVTTEVVRAADGDKGLNLCLAVPFGPSEASAPSALRLRTSPSLREDYFSTPTAQGDYLQGDQDLRSFRGKLTAPYIAAHADRVFGLPAKTEQATGPTWPLGVSWEGTSGLMRIPTADVLPDGTVAVGTAFIDRDHSRTTPQSSVTPAFVGFGFLPNVEIVGRLSFLHDLRSPYWDDPYSLDRSYHVQWRVHRQTERLPAIALGGQDLSWGTGGSVIGRALYLVTSWQSDDMWRFHAGVGSGRLAGVFGGAEYMLARARLDLMAEYDGKYVNVGVRKYLGEWGSFDLGALGLDRLGASVTFHTNLK